MKDEYEATSDAFTFTEEQNLQLFPAISRGEASLYYNENIHKTAKSYEEAVDSIESHFNDLPHQHRVKNYLLGLKLEAFEKDGVNTRDGLIKLCAEVKTFFTQVPRSNRCEDNRITILKNAVLGRPWPSAPISDLPKADTTCHSFYSALANALQN